MNKKINNTVEKYNMLSFGDKVLAAVSGGADSMLLLHYLISVKDKYSLTVEVAHVEHGIRGEESLKDAEFVEHFCIDNNIRFWKKSINATEEAKEAKLSVEEYSRNQRYDFFNTIDCDKIATAHNLSDNIETVLFRLSRGTGLNGICGIPAVRGKIIRPLIEVSGRDIRDYCNSNNISYKVDKTNYSNDYSRNYVRNVIVDDFLRLNEHFEENVKSFIDDINDDYRFLNEYSLSVYDNCLIDNMLSLNNLKSYDTPIIKLVIKRFFKDNGIILDRFHLNSVLKLLDSSGKVQIKGDIFAISSKGFLRITDISNHKEGTHFGTKILKKFEFNPKEVDFYCDYDKIVGSVILRTRQTGDTISPAKRGCTKSLKKLYNELAIPVEKRENVLVVCDDMGVIGIVGYCADERVAFDSSTENVFTVKVSLED